MPSVTCREVQRQQGGNGTLDAMGRIVYGTPETVGTVIGALFGVCVLAVLWRWRAPLLRRFGCCCKKTKKGRVEAEVVPRRRSVEGAAAAAAAAAGGAAVVHHATSPHHVASPHHAVSPRAAGAAAAAAARRATSPPNPPRRASAAAAGGGTAAAAHGQPQQRHAGSGGGTSPLPSHAAPRPVDAVGELNGGAPGWTRYMDDVSGRPYWYSSATGVSSWVEPPQPATEAVAAVSGYGAVAPELGGVRHGHGTV